MTYIGIDLGTTNSVICSYDGENVRLLKSPEQHDVTPSALYIGRRGNKYVGARAYTDAVRNPDNAAVLFKRVMGTKTPIKLPGADITLTPEECSAEVLRTLFGYLPEEIRRNNDGGTVVTVPAAFNQVQKSATKTAAELAGLGEVQLIQEPVAAVMSVMRNRNTDGTFLIYDIGGGTLDVAIAESIAGRVSLLSHGGIEMCGGRDFDRTLYDNIVKPWLLDNFDLPDRFPSDPKYQRLFRMAQRAVELAKIELSQRELANVVLDETELSIQDLSGEDIYIDIEVDRERYNTLIASRVEDSVQATREAIQKAGLRPDDLEKIVFIGGPAQYKPLRDMVSSELAVSPSTEVNPMTAVAEGAAIFAESIDWGTKSRKRKSSVGKLNAGKDLGIELRYRTRTPETKTKLVIKLDSATPDGLEFQVDNTDTGWSSGRIQLEDGVNLTLTLSKPGENNFRLFVFNENGAVVPIPEDRIVVTRTAASIDAIPASHSIGLEVLADSYGSQSQLFLLIKEGEQLPMIGNVVVKSTETLKAGDDNSIVFKLWEGDIEDRPKDNRYIGSFRIDGIDIEDGVIPAGADLICKYAMQDSGKLNIDVEIPTFNCLISAGKDFYSPQDAMVDFHNQSTILQEKAQSCLEEVEFISEQVDDSRLETARDKLESVILSMETEREIDAEGAKENSDAIQEVKRNLSKVRKDHRQEIRQLELDRVVDSFDRVARSHGSKAEVLSFDNLVETTRRVVETNTGKFENFIEELRSRLFAILYRQDDFIIAKYRRMTENSFMYFDEDEYESLVIQGNNALSEGDIDELREIIYKLYRIRIDSFGDDNETKDVNIIRG